MSQINPKTNFDYEVLYKQMVDISNHNYSELCDATQLLRECLENLKDTSTICKAKVEGFLDGLSEREE